MGRKEKASPFDGNRLWRLTDLTGKHRREAKEAGCEADKYYCGEPLDDNEVPQCPFLPRAGLAPDEGLAGVTVPPSGDGV